MSLRRNALCTSILLLSCAIIPCPSLHQEAAYASGDAERERGSIVFHTRGCERCHSITGVGGDRAPDLGSVGQRKLPNAIRAQILKGGGGMPPFQQVLSKDEVKDVVAFLTSCRTDTAPGCRSWEKPSQ